MRKSALVAALLVSFAVAAAGARDARGDEQSDLDKGRNAYLARQYDEADARFRTMLDPKTGTLHDVALINQAEMYWGAVMMAKGRPQEASSIFEKLLLRDSHYEPDPLGFPTDVLDAFVDTRAKIRDRLNAAAEEAAKRDAERKAREEAEKQREIRRVKVLEQLAGEEEITERHSRIVALVPFGAGQFQNGQRALGLTLFISETAMVAVAATMAPLYYIELKGASDAYVPATNKFATSEGQAHLDRANTYRLVNLGFCGAFAATAIVGIVQANVVYVPEVDIVKKRPIPQTGIAPLLQPAQGGAIFGARGVF